MYNYNELQAVALSPTKKDYYQIWNELIDVAKKLSTRWDPSATNESDPGIVLLKVLTAIADKLNYNIDANTLEAFMPSAAQESSMRKLCEMLGYNMRYFKSATTNVRIIYNGNIFPENGMIVIDRFTNIKDKNSTYNYITTSKAILSPEIRSVIVECIEGELVNCQTENGNVVTLTHLDDNNRFYLPEQQIASNDNCIFISRIDTPDTFWKSTDNLNTCLLGQQVYQFGFDSNRALPYVQFPEDIGSLIGSGLNISFIRTRGAAGNIAVDFLKTMEKPLSWEVFSVQESETITASELVDQSNTKEDTSWQDLEQYSVTNLSPARNGRNPETIDEAYWNYQKTIGTFDTLVTCRDYMNKIYQMTFSDLNTTPLVSNVIVSDIRDDINRAYTICTYANSGVEHKKYAHIDSNKNDRIHYFDLVLYPFQTVYGINDDKEFEDSFTYTSDPIIINHILAELEDNKTIAHNFIHPEPEDIVCIKVYFQVSARLTTTSKVSVIEAAEIESAAHSALYRDFNMRHMSFGSELPYDSILKTLTLADPRIKNVILDDPKMQVKVCLKNGEEIQIIGNQIYQNEEAARRALNYYKQLVLANVLAGKTSLFNYDTDFPVSFTDHPYDFTYTQGETTIGYPTFFDPEVTDSRVVPGDPVKPESGVMSTPDALVSNFEIYPKELVEPLVLSNCEVVQFRAPNFKTVATYPAYVNYYAKLDNTTSTPATPATMLSIKEFFSGGPKVSEDYTKFYQYCVESSEGSGSYELRTEGDNVEDTWNRRRSWEEKVRSLPRSIFTSCLKFKESTNGVLEETDAAKARADFKEAQNKYGALFVYPNKTPNPKLFELPDDIDVTTKFLPAGLEFYAVDLTKEHFEEFLEWLKNDAIHRDPYGQEITDVSITDIYYRGTSNTGRPRGKLVDGAGMRYKPQKSLIKTGAEALIQYYVPQLHKDDKPGEYTKDGLGKDAEIGGIPANAEYCLKNDEYILLTYSTSEGREDGVAVVKNVALGPNTIIKANFNLQDSYTKSLVSKFPKLSNYGPWQIQDDKGTTAKGINVEEVPGMFTFGAAEQLEVREPIKVELDKQITNIFWELSTKKVIGDYEYFPFEANGSYILKAGEYLFYTDEAKESLVYYGAGTEIKRNDNTPVIRVKNNDKTLSVRKANELGLVASLPWTPFDLTGENCSLTITEYKVINLAAEDTLLTVELETDGAHIDNQFRNVKTATYKIAGNEGKLADLYIDDITWQVRGKLELALGPENPQLLKVHYNEGGNEVARASIAFAETGAEQDTILQLFTPLSTVKKSTETTNNVDGTQVTVTKSNVTGDEMYVYSNIPILGADGRYVFEREDKKDSSSKLKIPKLKLCAKSQNIIAQSSADPKVKEKISLVFDTTGFAKCPLTHGDVSINVIVPEQDFSLITFYVASSGQKRIRLAYAPYADDNSSVSGLEIFNYYSTQSESFDWWDGYKKEDKGIIYYELREGLNTVKVPATGTISIAQNDEAQYVLISQAHAIYKKNQFNYKLAFESYDEALAQKLELRNIFSYYDGKDENGKPIVKDLTVGTEEVYEYIREIDKNNEFYYTYKPSDFRSLDLNELDPADTLKDPKNWFDSQNVVNKFVVTELEADYLKEYVAVSKFSRSEL